VIIILDFYLKSSEGTIKENCSYKNINNKLTFNINNDKYILEKGKDIRLKKENDESILDFIYINNKDTEGTYYIKELNLYIDAKIKNNMIKIIDNLIHIKYELYIQDNFIDNFELKISIKE